MVAAEAVKLPRPFQKRAGKLEKNNCISVLDYFIWLYYYKYKLFYFQNRFPEFLFFKNSFDD